MVVIPTLEAGDTLAACLASLERQTWRGLDIVVVDNSGSGAAQPIADRFAARTIRNARNVGFGAAINQAIRATPSDYVAALNDDAVAEPQWMEALVSTILHIPSAGMCASCVILEDSGLVDSAGMLLASDGSSKQRGHGQDLSRFQQTEEVLLPSGSAALYSRAMLDQVGLFDEQFFLYCEDTDLGLRARWAGWSCLYAPDARVRHAYSKSAGRASALKAYYVERNRLFVVAKNFPARMLPAVLPASIARYWHHATAAFGGRGAAGAFRHSGGNPLLLLWLVAKAHLALLFACPRLLAERWRIRRTAKITAAEFCALAWRHAITVREVAAQ